MNYTEESEIRTFLHAYTVEGPPDEIVRQTISLMEYEQSLALKIAPEQRYFLYLVGLAVVMTLCLFYTLTINALLMSLIPPRIMEIVFELFVVSGAAGGGILSTVFSVLLIKVCLEHRRVYRCPA